MKGPFSWVAGANRRCHTLVFALVSPAPDCLATTVRFWPPAGLDEPMAKAGHELTTKRAIYSSSSS
jgi:hypothetical protein